MQDAWLGESKRIAENKRAVNAAGAEGYFSVRYRERSEAFLRTVTRYRLLELLISSLPALLSCALAAAMMGAAAWRCAVRRGAGVGQVLVAYSLAQLVQAPLTAIVAARGAGSRQHAARRAPARGGGVCGGALRLRGARDDGREGPGGARGRHPLGDARARRGRQAPLGGGARACVLASSWWSAGANGTGKSRLLDFLRGLSDPADLDGRAGACARRCSGPPASPTRCPSSAGDLAYNLLGAAADPEVARVLDLGDLPGRAITDQPLNLSLGERQKLGLLRALSRQEPVTLLDEPLANLDAATSARLCDYLAGRRGQRTVVAIMHSDDLDAAADRIYEICDGRLARVK